MKPLQAAAPFVLRQESVDAPELGGAVIVRGLLASESFAVSAFRSQALRRIREERRGEPAAGAEGDAQASEHATIDPAVLTFDELRLYGSYVSHLLACAVTVGNGMQLYSAAQWEVAGQHHPALLVRLQTVAERLSGLNAEAVEKN
jgi:hypothetical protein